MKSKFKELEERYREYMSKRGKESVKENRSRILERKSKRSSNGLLDELNKRYRSYISKKSKGIVKEGRNNIFEDKDTDENDNDIYITRDGYTIVYNLEEKKLKVYKNKEEEDEDLDEEFGDEESVENDNELDEEDSYDEENEEEEEEESDEDEENEEENKNDKALKEALKRVMGIQESFDDNIMKTFGWNVSKRGNIKYQSRIKYNVNDKKNKKD